MHEKVFLYHKHAMKYFLFPLVFLLITACGNLKPKTPTPQIEASPNLTQANSVVSIPIEINLKNYFQQAEKSAPKNLKGEDSKCQGLSYAYRFEREPIEFDGKGSDLFVTINGKYGLKANYCPLCTSLFGPETCVSARVYLSCGDGKEPMRRIQIEYQTNIQVASNYQIQSTTKLKNLKALDPCEVSFVNYDVTKQVLDEVEKNLVKTAKELDKQIESFQLRPEVQKIWDQLNTEIDLKEFGKLNLHPSQLSMGDVNFQKNKLSLSVGLELNPILSLYSLEKNKKSLPNLQKKVAGEGFNLNVDIKSTYDTINARLAQSMKGQEFDIQGKKVILNEVKIFGASNSNVLIEVLFSGSKSGKLFLLGAPYFDKNTQEIGLKNVSFDLDTKDALLRSIKWLFNPKVTQLIEKNSRFSIKKELETCKQEIEKQLNAGFGDGIKSIGKLNQLDIDGIYPAEKDLSLRVRLSGSLRLIVE